VVLVGTTTAFRERRVAFVRLPRTRANDPAATAALDAWLEAAERSGEATATDGRSTGAGRPGPPFAATKAGASAIESVLEAGSEATSKFCVLDV